MSDRKMIYLDDAVKVLEKKKDKRAKGDIGRFYNTIIQNAIDALADLPSAEAGRSKGEWTEMTVIENPKAAGIEELQSCRCSNCGRYDTRPYLYYFDKPNFCSWCGADMRGGRNEP